MPFTMFLVGRQQKQGRYQPSSHKDILIKPEDAGEEMMSVSVVRGPGGSHVLLHDCSLL